MNILNKKAISMVEYTVLLVIIIGAFLVMKNYLQRGIYGNWGKTGQSFAFGRQYDPQKSIDCAFDEQSGQWYDRNCYEAKISNSACNGDPVCEEGAITGSCLVSSNSSCGQLNNGGAV